jgi:ElaA protein
VLRSASLSLRLCAEKENTMNITWTLKHFKDLTASELYAIMQLRAEVFIVEQNCPYQDADGKDLKSWHLMGYSDSAGSKLVVYARLLPQNVSYAEASIGRVVSSPAVRGTGAGRELMKQCIVEMKKLFGEIPIRIGAQMYLQKFYEDFEFVREGDEYDEDGIPHVIMLRK